ncbi:MAG: Tic20 family protein [Leptolyngbya sp.]|nr:Tic20 family protein [Leptolyngbya sp.]
MTWNSSPTLLDRVFASLPYILAITAGLPYGVFVMREIPAIQMVLLPIAPLLQVYMGLQRSIPFFGLIVFFALILLVVRNENISRFIRFNTMQAILLSFMLAVGGLILQLLMPVLGGGGLLVQTFASALFLGMLASVGYSLVQTFRGEYAEIPTISEAVHMQVR